MKKSLIIPMFLFLMVTGAFAQQRKQFVFPPDSLLKQLPRFENREIDTLRFYKPGDTIPNQLWENYLKSKKETNKTFKAPLDNMPIIVPPNHTFSMTVIKPDSTVHYHIRNFGENDNEKKQ